jgi:hypothetical protein
MDVSYIALMTRKVTLRQDSHSREQKRMKFILVTYGIKIMNLPGSPERMQMYSKGYNNGLLGCHLNHRST